MTANDIQTAVAAYMQETVGISDVVTAINEFLTWLGDMANLFGDATIGAYTGSWLPLPAGFVTAVSIEDETGSPYTGAEIVGKMIRFPASGTYKVKYRRAAAPITQGTDTLEISDLFKNAVVYKVVSWLKLRRDDEDIDGMRLAGECVQETAKVAGTLAAGNTFRSKVVGVIR